MMGAWVGWSPQRPTLPLFQGVLHLIFHFQSFFFLLSVQFCCFCSLGGKIVSLNYLCWYLTSLWLLLCVLCAGTHLKDCSRSYNPKEHCQKELKCLGKRCLGTGVHRKHLHSWVYYLLISTLFSFTTFDLCLWDFWCFFWMLS